MFKEFEAKTEEEARNKAIEELGLQGGDFDVEILENVKKGLFKKPLCRIRVYYGEDEEEKEEESFEDKVENEERAEKGSCLQPINDVERKIASFFAADKVFYQDNTVGEIVRNYIMWCQKGE